MKITRVTFDPLGNEPIVYELGDKTRFGQSALAIQGISLEPTGQVVLELSGGNVVLYGNAPYRLEALVDAAEEKKE